jgi:ammonium transporter, Amt family
MSTQINSHTVMRVVRHLLLTIAFGICASSQSFAQDPTAELKALQDLVAEKVAKIEAEKKAEAAKPGNVVTYSEALGKLEAPHTISSKIERPALQRNIDHVWILLCGVLVFWMQAGFAMLEMGLTRAKNSINCAMKGLLDFCSATVCYLLFGFTLMFGPSAGGSGFIGTHSVWMSDFSGDSPIWSFWFFQVCFASAACTIASGAMAERTRFLGYMIYTAFFSGLVYPIFGHWAWGSLSSNYVPNFGGGQGWLEALEFHDFAGSTVVHAMGGACALAGVIVVGPRQGRFLEDGTVVTMPGHSIPFAFLGAFILWMGWFGFNAGSTLTAGPEIGRIAVNTCVSGASGGFFGLILIWVLRGVPDAASSINGLLAGAVSVTAGADVVTPFSALAMGAVGGVLCSLATVLMDRLKLDDVVGAVPVHLVCGVWGTVAVALFHEDGFNLGLLAIQVAGSLLIPGTAFLAALVVFNIIDATVGLRATDDEQEMGLDFSEHATNAYPDFKTAER